jgi:hypothetical protein
MRNPHKDFAIKELRSAANLINRAICNMTSSECKEKHNMSPRDWLRKTEPERLDEFDRLQGLVKGEIERGRNLLLIKNTIKSMGYNV